MENQIQASIDLIALHPDYQGIKIESEVKEISPKIYEANVFTSLTKQEDRRVFGEALSQIQNDFKRQYDITVNCHQYSTIKQLEGN